MRPILHIPREKCGKSYLVAPSVRHSVVKQDLYENSFFFIIKDLKSKKKYYVFTKRRISEYSKLFRLMKSQSDTVLLQTGDAFHVHQRALKS